MRMPYLPLVGIIVGAIAGLTFIAAEAVFDSKQLAVILSIALSMFVTGAFMETGSVALVMGVLIKYQSLLLIPSRSLPLVLIAAHAFSRYAAGSLTLPHQRPHRKGVITPRNCILMASLGMVPLILVGSFLFLLLVPLLWAIRTLLGVWLARKAGGYTTPRLLTTQHIIEACFYLLVIVAYKFAFDIPSF
jgi:adenosylcobinamide-GDP ribazoletransferase